MEIGSTTLKVRLVRCPKCRLLLPESPDVPVYKCGGCSTVLQVKKNRKNDAKSRSDDLLGTEAAQMNELDHVSEVRDSVNFTGKAPFPSSGERPLDLNSSNEEQNDESYHNESRDCSIIDQRRVSIKFCSATELARCGNEDASQLNEANLYRANFYVEVEDESSQSEIDIFHSPAGENVSSDALISSPDERPEQLQRNFKHGYNRVRCNDAFGADSEVEVNDESSQLVEAKPAVDINNESGSTSTSSDAENAVVTRENNSTATSHRPAGESISSDYLISCPDEQPKLLRANFKHGYNEGNSTCRSLNTENTVVTATVNSSRLVGERVSSDVLKSSPEEQAKKIQTSFKHGYNRVRSNDTFATTSFFSSRSEQSGTIRNSHAYDGSVSSFDGFDDQVPDHQHIYAYRNPNKFAGSVVSEERSRRDKFLVNGDPEMQYQTRNLSSMNNRKWDRDELRESTRLGHAFRNVTRFESNEFQSLASLYRGDYLAGYESGSTSSQLHNEFHSHSSEQEKIKLLRMVYELQDQLNRTGYVNEKANHQGSSDVTATEKYVPAYYSREISEEEISQELKYHRYHERYRQGSNWSHQYKYSHIPFSGEVTNASHCIADSCFHCSHSRGFCDSEFPICSGETKANDQRHEEYHVKSHMKGKTNLIKRHLRPTAGGSPFIICYRCLKLLQLPADFLLFKRRFHQLKCGACSEVLKFSLESRIHIVPYTPKAEAPPQSEVVDYRDDAVNRRNSCSFQGNNDYPQADPVSCSDDYGYSTDADHVFSAPFHNIQGNADARNMSHDSPESMKERNRFVPKQSRNKDKSPVQTYESARTSSSKSRSGNVSSEIKEELPVKTVSPLHQLMGYKSPSQVIRGSDH